MSQRIYQDDYKELKRVVNIINSRMKRLAKNFEEMGGTESETYQLAVSKIKSALNGTEFTYEIGEGFQSEGVTQISASKLYSARERSKLSIKDYIMILGDADKLVNTKIDLEASAQASLESNYGEGKSFSPKTLLIESEILAITSGNYSELLKKFYAMINELDAQKSIFDDPKLAESVSAFSKDHQRILDNLINVREQIKHPDKKLTPQEIEDFSRKIIDAMREGRKQITDVNQAIARAKALDETYERDLQNSTYGRKKDFMSAMQKEENKKKKLKELQREQTFNNARLFGRSK